MSEFKKNNIFDYNSDGETSLTEYIIGEKTIADSNKSVDVGIFYEDEYDFNIVDDKDEEDDF